MTPDTAPKRPVGVSWEQGLLALVALTKQASLSGAWALCVTCGFPTQCAWACAWYSSPFATSSQQDFVSRASPSHRSCVREMGGGVNLPERFTLPTHVEEALYAYGHRRD